MSFDFAQIISETIEDAIEDFASLYGFKISGSSYTSKIKRLITTLSKKNLVVVLIDEIRKRSQSIAPLQGMSAIESTLSDISRLDRIHLAVLMFQTGYLTIRGYNPEQDAYTLDFPNKEVKKSFFNSLLQECAEVEPLEITRFAKELKKNLESFDLSTFIRKMNSHFLHIFRKLCGIRHSGRNRD